MLTPIFLRDLLVDPALHPLGQPHLSAASGLVRVQGRLYVVADDELHLGVLDDIGHPPAPGEPPPPLVRLVRVLDGKLPHDKGKRKQQKPDLESLALLPPMAGCPYGALLAFGSGSRPTRETGVLVVLDAQGNTTDRMAPIDLAALYAPLHARFADLNIEGAFVASGELRLLQRGNKGTQARNASINFDWNHVAPWLLGQRPAPPAVKAVQAIELGAVNGVPLGLTDGAALGGGAWVFSAVAEDTDNSYADGACVGSAVGIVEADGRVRRMELLAGAPKVEGVAVRVLEGGALEVTMVTDGDDPAVAGRVLSLRM
jgi:hypothetical protein